jgi:nitroreductase
VTIDLYDAMRTARAIRRYRPDPVPDDVLRRCLEAATWAPSGSNRQAWRFVVLRSPEVRAILGPAYRKGWAEMSGGYGISGDIDPSDTSPTARMGRTMRHFVDHFEDVPVYVLFCLKGRGFSHLSEGASIYPAVQNFVLAARAEGLGTVMTSWFMFCERELRDAIGVPDDWMLAALLPLGYPVGHHGPVRRRPVEQVVAVDRWDTPFS